MKKEIVKETMIDDSVRYGYYDLNKFFVYHREDGPATIYPDGKTKWWFEDKLHREHGPAVIYPDERQEWWINDKLHHEDGPAVICDDGTEEWWINDKQVTNEVEEWLYERNIDSENMTEEDKLALSFYMRSLV